MRVLVVHNYYQRPGGEDQCFRAEVEMLCGHGHEVVTYERHNDDVAKANAVELAAATIWNRQAYRDVTRRIAATKPDVVHCHNTFPLVSPAVYYAAHRSGVPVVQTLHNYRLICPGSLLLRDGRPCEICIGKSTPWPAVMHRCYRGSRMLSLGVVSMLETHRVLGTWQRRVTAFLAPSRFAKRKLIEGGLPPHRIHVKPNFVANDPGAGTGEGDYVIYVGRLSHEKGLPTLLRAWQLMADAPPLKIAGDGPLMTLRDTVPPGVPVEFLGHLPTARLHELVKKARLLVAPSECYEVFPLGVVEAFACGTPVLASDRGAFAELVDDGRTGLRFAPQDAGDLAAKATKLLRSPETLAAMRQEARREYETKYTDTINYRLLIDIYESAVATARSFARESAVLHPVPH